MSSAAFGPLRESGRGCVVNITATLHYTATWWQSAACAAKSAIDSLTRSLALEWGAYNIRVNGIAPGPIADTPGMTKLSGGQSADELDRAMRRAVPLGRPGTKDEIGNAAIFLLTNPYVSGTDVVVDGGNWLMTPWGIPREMVKKISKGVEKKSRAMGPAAASATAEREGPTTVTAAAEEEEAAATAVAAKRVAFSAKL